MIDEISVQPHFSASKLCDRAVGKYRNRFGIPQQIPFRNECSPVGLCAGATQWPVADPVTSFVLYALRTNKNRNENLRQTIYFFSTSSSCTRSMAAFANCTRACARRNAEIPFACVILNSVKVNFDISLFLMDFTFFRRRHNRCADCTPPPSSWSAHYPLCFRVFPVPFLFAGAYEKFISLTVAHGERTFGIVTSLSSLSAA